ncbi:MAG TPA: HAMP domain-containing sensor histidine kinase [Actinomycetota bacterium]
MDRSLRMIAWPLGVCVVAIATWVLGWDAALHQASTVAWLGLALTAVAIVHLRASRDPDVFLFAIAGAVLTLQSCFASLVISGADGADLEPLTIANTALLMGWAVSGFCLALGSPWWDRRGRPQIASSSFGAGMLMIVGVADVLLFVFPPTSADAGIPASHIAPISGVGWFWLVLGIAAWAIVAVRRSLLIRRGSHHAVVAAAAIAAIVGLASGAALARSTDPLIDPAIGPYVWMQPLSIALLLVGVALMHRADVTRMRRASDRAEEIVEGRAEIAGMIAHEVRGPVTTIRGIAATATTHYERLSDEERQEFFGLIEQESRRLMGTVDQTSLALKIDAGSLTYQKAPAPLATIVRAGVDAAAIPSEVHVVHVVAQEEVSLVADASRITELVRQLVDNASKFSPPGTPIVVRAVSDGSAAVIEITDEGPGIPAENRDAVFQRFARWRPRGYEEQPGNGLGLFICRAIAAEHQGEMSVEDGPDGGTMLRVRLPLEGA